MRLTRISSTSLTCAAVAGLTIASIAFPSSSHAFLGFGGNKGEKVLSPDEMANNEQEASAMLADAQAKESSVSPGKARGAYEDIVKRFPRTTAAAESQYKVGEMREAEGKEKKAFDAYQKLIDEYKGTSHFAQAIRRQYEIAVYAMEHQKKGFLGFGAGIQPSVLVEMFDKIKANAPQSEFAPLSLYNKGVVEADRGNEQAAIDALESVVQNYPNSKTAADAQFQIVQVMKKMSDGSNNAASTRRLRESAEDALNLFGEDDRAADVKAVVGSLEDRESSKNFDVGRFYEKQGNVKSAAVYYREVLKYPGTARYEAAKERLAILAETDPSLAVEPRRSVRDLEEEEESAASGSQNTKDRKDYLGPPPPNLESTKPQMRTSPEDVVPIPVPETGS